MKIALKMKDKSNREVEAILVDGFLAAHEAEISYLVYAQEPGKTKMRPLASVTGTKANLIKDGKGKAYTCAHNLIHAIHWSKCTAEKIAAELSEAYPDRKFEARPATCRLLRITHIPTGTMIFVVKKADAKECMAALNATGFFTDSPDLLGKMVTEEQREKIKHLRFSYEA